MFGFVGKLFYMIDNLRDKFNTFEKPWHGQIFAITVLLSEKNVFGWKEFSNFFTEQIKKDKNKNQNGGDDYFFTWIIALEKLLKSKNILDSDNLKKVNQKLTNAFLKTHMENK